jgi:DNA-binding NtrC family response regulator
MDSAIRSRSETTFAAHPSLSVADAGNYRWGEDARAMVTVLIIDNDLGFMFWLGQILNEAGYAVLQSRSASEAVDLMSENNIEADLLIIDPSSSDVVRLVAELRRSRSGLKVIAFH